MPSAITGGIVAPGICFSPSRRQNRFKSILCQEELYLKEVVGYIHLNPLRAQIVVKFTDLVKYP